MGADMTSVINDDVEAFILLYQLGETFLAGLIALVNVNSILVKATLVLDINADNLTIAEVRLPHAQRFSTMTGVVISTNPNFKYVQTLLLQRPEVALIVLSVPMRTPF